METNNTVRCRWALKKPILSVRHVRIYTLYYVPSRALTVTAAFVTALFTLNRRPDAHGLMGHQTEFDRHPSVAAPGTPRVVLYGNFAAEDRCCYIVFTASSIKRNKKMIVNVFIPLLLNFLLLLSLRGCRWISYQRLRLLTNTYNGYTLGYSTANRGHVYSAADISINWLLQFWLVWTTFS